MDAQWLCLNTPTTAGLKPPWCPGHWSLCCCAWPCVKILNINPLSSHLYHVLFLSRIICINLIVCTYLAKQASVCLFLHTPDVLTILIHDILTTVIHDFSLLVSKSNCEIWRNWMVNCIVLWEFLDCLVNQLNKSMVYWWPIALCFSSYIVNVLFSLDIDLLFRSYIVVDVRVNPTQK